VTKSTKLILVADDYEGAAELLAELVECIPGYRAVAVTDGLLAYEAAVAKRPDAVLLDLDMPRMTGIEAARALRSYFATSV